MKVLGLDLSTKPGYAVFDGPRLITYGTLFELKAQMAAAERERKQAHPDWVSDYDSIATGRIVAEAVASIVNQYQPDFVIIEQTNKGRARGTQKTLEFIHFAVLARLQGMAHKIRYIDTSRWRNICGQHMSKEQRKHNKDVKDGKIRGKITAKHLAVLWCNSKYGLNLLMKDEDAADAISLAWAWAEAETAIKPGRVDVDKVFAKC